MNQPTALPFTHRRTDSSFGDEWVTTTESVHGLLRLEADRLVIQWRSARSVEKIGSTVRTDRDVDPVREVEVPLDALASASLRFVWWRWPPGLHLVLVGADLLAFEAFAGADGLRLDHPAELMLRIRRSDRYAARLFAVEIEMAAADRALRAAEHPRLDHGSDVPRPGPSDAG
jgi:hypothetical protein